MSDVLSSRHVQMHNPVQLSILVLYLTVDDVQGCNICND